MSFNVIKASDNISEKYVRYLKTIFNIGDPIYKGLFESELSTTRVFSKGPYLDVVDSFETGKTIPQLIGGGVLNLGFNRIGSIYKRTLYVHQEKALEKLHAGLNVVVYTGTGSV